MQPEYDNDRGQEAPPQAFRRLEAQEVRGAEELHRSVSLHCNVNGTKGGTSPSNVVGILATNTSFPMTSGCIWHLTDCVISALESVP